MRTLYLASAAAMAIGLAACGNENNVEPEDTAAAEAQQERGVVANPEGEGDAVMADADTIDETEPMVGEDPAPDAGMTNDADMAMDNSTGDDTVMSQVMVTFETSDAVTGSATAELSYAESAGALMMTVEGSGFPPGEHGIHLHETGDCSAADFTSAGGHVGKGMAQHGLENPEGPEAGDLPNLEVAEDGSFTQEFSTDRVTLYAPDGDTPALMDADGSAIVIHAQPDDQTTQPIGGAGDRIACAVIEGQS